MNFAQTNTVTMPATTFHSTSTLHSTGSTYTANPWLTDLAQTNAISIPTAAFQSTSTLQSTGSAYASSPWFGADANAQTMVPGREPRRIGPPTRSGDPTPVGDALLPLLLMAVLYTFVKRRLNVLA